MILDQSDHVDGPVSFAKVQTEDPSSLLTILLNGVEICVDVDNLVQKLLLNTGFTLKIGLLDV